MTDSSFMPDEPEVGRTRKTRKRKPVEVWWRSTRKYGLFRDWSRFGRYASREVAEKVVAAQTRKFGDHWEFKIKGGSRDGD